MIEMKVLAASGHPTLRLGHISRSKECIYPRGRVLAYDIARTGLGHRGSYAPGLCAFP